MTRPGPERERRLPPHRSARRPGFGVVLLLILGELVFRLAAPDEDWANFVSILLQVATLGAAMIAAHVPQKLARLAWLVMAALVGVSAAALLSPTAEVGSFLLITAGLVLLTPVMIVYGTVRSFRAAGTITVGVMFGVLSVYLLLGYAFSLVFQAIADLGPERFFADGAAESPANFLYFSFVTMTTVGYGDLAPASEIGRAFSVALALVGQIYLVTVVAMIVSNLGARPRGNAPA